MHQGKKAGKKQNLILPFDNHKSNHKMHINLIFKLTKYSQRRFWNWKDKLKHLINNILQDQFANYGRSCKSKRLLFHL